jgi:hypothetical protein
MALASSAVPLDGSAKAVGDSTKIAVEAARYTNLRIAKLLQSRIQQRDVFPAQRIDAPHPFLSLSAARGAK